MKITTLVLMLPLTPALSWATTPLPFVAEIGILDRISAAATASETSAVALKLLECVAKGQTDGIQEGWESQVGIAQNRLKAKEFSDPSVRAHALWAIGETGLPAALGFLSKLTPSDFQVDASGRLWVDAQVALSNALLTRIADPQLKIEFLMHTMKTSAAASWAGEELCDRGALAALPEVQKWMKGRRSGQPGEADSEFCEARMRAVARDPDRARALGSVFSNFVSSASNLQAQQLIRWAIDQLAALKSAEADAELGRFREQIGVALRGNPGQDYLVRFLTEINFVRNHSAK